MTEPSMTRHLSAPAYEPSPTFHPPQPAPFAFGVETVTMEELMSAPATRAILEKNAGWAVQMVGNENFKPFASIFTLRDAGTFVPFDIAKSLVEVDAALRALPRSEWPRDVE
jgi:hypothetical protein